jgi:hypothetical protein
VLVSLLAWTTWCGGTIARIRGVGLLHRTLAGVAALLALPAALVAIALGSIETARAVQDIRWVWSVVCLAALVQPMLAIGRDRAPIWLALPAVLWNLAALLDASARGLDAYGVALPDAAHAVLTLPRAAWGLVIGDVALSSAWTIVPPILVPVWPPRWRGTRLVHAALALVALAGAAGVAIVTWPHQAAIASYRVFAREPVRERPGGDFSVGLAALAPVTEMPAAAVARVATATLDVLETGVVRVEVRVPARPPVLDSLARVLDFRRRVGSAMLVEIIGGLREAARDSAAIAAVARRFSTATVVVSTPRDSAPLDRWAARVRRRAAAAHAASERVGVAIRVSPSDERRYQWAVESGAVVDAIVLGITPTRRGASDLTAQWQRYSGWIATTGTLKPHWIDGAGGAPAFFGGAQQRLAMIGTLAWATNERVVRGVILGDAADQGTLSGVRTATGRWRPAAGTALRAARVIRETRIVPTPVAPLDVP